MNHSELPTDPTLAANSSNGDFLPGRLSNHSCPLGWGLKDGVEACVLETAVIVLLTVLIIVGNVTVIFVFHCAPLLHHYTTSYFIQTMAYADLLVGLSCLVPTLSLLYYPAGVQEPITCQVFSYVISVLKSVSMACLACISVDRYLAITKPLSYNQLVTPCRLRGCIALIWVYSSLVFLPSFFGWGKPGYHGDIFEWCAHSWPTSAIFTGFVVCFLYAPAALVVCFTYYHIFRICQQHNREISERRARFPSQEMEPGEGNGSGHHGGHGPDRRYAMRVPTCWISRPCPSSPPGWPLATAFVTVSSTVCRTACFAWACADCHRLCALSATAVRMKGILGSPNQEKEQTHAPSEGLLD
ncbi:G-protein coupled receptor 52 isoform X2 [Fundulus heteroclitus]|uniref:G-protein coupled receptor 52 isoform X2 n=1 Tax=Fundulus heteroclitus TaxID=8078 RepID=UPI00165A5F69|nr:G-protein coupled receptor 52 isoform X2 [Fundulus heteroclitus]